MTDGDPTALTRRPAPARMLWITAALGTCFLGVRWGLRDAPLLWFAALRAQLGGAALTFVACVQRRPIPRSAGTWGFAAGGAPGRLSVAGPPGRDASTVADLHDRTPLKEHR